MASAPKVTANPPAENTNPWYAARTTYDGQLKARANGAVVTDGTAASAGAVFWGVFEEGSEPTPPDDGQVHWGFRVNTP
jgi:hypothetical protein